MKVAIIIMSDPKTGGEEALGRLYNGLAVAYEFKQKGDEFTILFQGAGTRWAGEVTREYHPAHALFKEVKDHVAGVSSGCAEVFGATEAAQKNGLELVRGNPLPESRGLPSLHGLMADGYTVLSF
ncbi:MAG: DsrE family protein [Ectothiorhodospiraceae bacterium]|nr:DsrE family protein [Ectothiorhodospiraceae bacterium]MBN4052989.1 DsrE family protein [Gammaproteobacteria bacterium AH-315-K14]